MRMEMTASSFDNLKNQVPFLWINPDKKLDNGRIHGTE